MWLNIFYKFLKLSFYVCIFFIDLVDIPIFNWIKWWKFAEDNTE